MAGLTRGDPVPNFRRYDHHGALRKLYDDLHCGQPLVLLLIRGPASAEVAEAMAALSHGESAEHANAFIGLLTASVERCKVFGATYAFNFPVLADDGSLINYLAGSKPPEHALTLLALDSNLRVLKRFDATTRQAFQTLNSQLAQLYREFPVAEPRVLTSPAPVLTIPRVFEPDFCDELVDSFRQHGGMPSGVMYIEGEKTRWAPDPETKIRKDYTIEDAQCQEKVKASLARRVLPEIQKCFNYTVTQHEPFKLICYESDTGGYFRPHRDNATKDAAHRRFAMTLNLNTGDYTGGELRFPEFGPHLYAPERGGAVVFSCSLVHEARDVTAGKRYAMLGFFFGDEPTRQPA